jgi:hypothetical protein
VGHGFTAENLASGLGNYSFEPRDGLRFIVLDSANERGGDRGNIDHEQFEWLNGELRQAQEQRDLALVFAHHPLEAMNQPPASPFPPGDDTGGNATPLVHYGEAPPGSPAPTPCTRTDPGAGHEETETLRCLLLRNRSAIAFVNAHEHENRVTPYERRDGAGKLDGGFWEINVASHVDWPQQSRLIEVVDNLDTNLSIFVTMLDHAGRANPGGAPCERERLHRDERDAQPPVDDDPGCDTGIGDGQGASPEALNRLTSISRELAYNDPQANNGEDGFGDNRGSREDRNAELVIRNPYAAP